jgi:hypothetical protein
MGMLRLVSAVPFTLFGIASTVLVLTGYGVLPVEGVWRLWMLPAHIVHLGLVIAAVGLLGEPPSWLWILTLPLRIAPFTAFDLLVAKCFYS